MQHLKSIAESPNQRWVTDIATVDCGCDGWCVFVPVIDCCSREVLGWELAHSALEYEIPRHPYLTLCNPSHQPAA